MKRKICFVTGSRAEYGILAPLMKEIRDSEEAELRIIATNMHLSPAFGMTVKEIEADGFTIDHKVESLLSADTPSSTVKSMGLTQIGLADIFSSMKPDLLVILGDRYEMLAVASAALIFRIPVAHLHGGEITEGAYDDAIRHAITKLSSLHFASTEEYAARIIRMGESPDRVFTVGAPGADNIRKAEIPTLKDLESSIGFRLGEKYVAAVFHPVTTRPGDEEELTRNFLEGLESVLKDGYKILFTLPNSDTGGLIVKNLITEWASGHPGQVLAVTSLGRLRFYSALKHSSALAGNSSSGLIEAPSFGIPTVNVGDRQKGRTSGPSVIHCGDSASEISNALAKALSPDFKKKLSSLPPEALNPYEKKDSVKNIAEKLLHCPLPGVKSFYEP